MSTELAQLPGFVRRPLWGAALGIVVFVGAFFIWAVYAPLATTITLRGTIQSSQPSFALQHPYGGLVSEVAVEVHDEVKKDQILMRFDTTLERKTLAVQRSIRDRLVSENTEILAVINATSVNADNGLSPLMLRRRQVELQAETARLTNESLAKQIAALRSKIRHADAQLALMTGRAERFAELSDQGWTRRTDDEALQEQILIVKGEIETDRASIFNLQSQVRSAEQRQSLAVLAFKQELTTLFQENLKRLDELESSILNLTDRIDRSLVRAPTSGVVASLPVQAEHMVAARGATLATLAQPLQQGRVSFVVPVDYIDQVSPGMSAQLVIPSLPQREMPDVEVVIDAISPRAELDEAGNPSGFAGLAYTELDNLERQLSAGNLGTLSEDMPILLMVSIRQTTLADYLTAPLRSAFARALQD
ncbi:MAG: HlyD family efflux transporter periplasmic adaptor subunit [Pseudomonadota bacterium]